MMGFPRLAPGSSHPNEDLRVGHASPLLILAAFPLAAAVAQAEPIACIQDNQAKSGGSRIGSESSTPPNGSIRLRIASAKFSVDMRS
jgi:hypothetical protein